jgi:glutaminase
MKNVALEPIILSSFYEIKHRIPGRVRLYIPALEKLPKDWYSLANIVQDLIILKRGIKNASIAPLSGTIVLRYSPESIGERDVLKWIESIVMRFIDLRRSRKKLTLQECISTLHYLIRRFQLYS